MPVVAIRHRFASRPRLFGSGRGARKIDRRERNTKRRREEGPRLAFVPPPRFEKHLDVSEPPGAPSPTENNNTRARVCRSWALSPRIARLDWMDGDAP